MTPKRLTLAALAILILTGVWFGSGSLKAYLYPLRYRQHIKDASIRYKLDPYLVSAIIYQESKFKPESRSPAGAVGLMQIMPGTARFVALKQEREFSLGALTRPEVNIDMGSWYVKYLLARYGSIELALAAYNGGHRNLDRWLAELDEKQQFSIDLIPFQETRDFIRRVMTTREQYRQLYPDSF